MTLEQAYRLGFQKAAEYYEAKIQKRAARRDILRKAAQVNQAITQAPSKLQKLRDQVVAIARDPQIYGAFLGHGSNKAVDAVNNGYQKGTSILNGVVDGYKTVAGTNSVNPVLKQKFQAGLGRIGSVMKDVVKRVDPRPGTMYPMPGSMIQPR